MKLISFSPAPCSLLPIPSSLPTATFTIPSSKKTAIFTPSICKTYKISQAKRVIYNPTLQLQSCKVTNILIFLLLKKPYFLTLQVQKQQIPLIIKRLHPTLQTLQLCKSLFIYKVSPSSKQNTSINKEISI